MPKLGRRKKRIYNGQKRTKPYNMSKSEGDQPTKTEDKKAFDSGRAENTEEIKDALQDFVATGRTGRRNALPDVLNKKAGSTSTAGLAESLEKMEASNKDQCPTKTQPAKEGENMAAKSKS